MSQERIVIDWNDYLKLLEKMIQKVKTNLPLPDLVVGIIRGGFYPADFLSRTLRIPWAYLYVQSYDDDIVPGEVRFGRELSGTRPERSQRILLVDDLVDSGQTLHKTMEWFETHFHGYDLTFQTAVLWKKVSSTFQPDLYLEEIPFIEGTTECPWIVQAHEHEADRIRKELGIS
jgi:hypothetical protein